MWKAGAVYASLDRLGGIVAEHLDRAESRLLCEHHQRQIEDVLGSQTGVPADEDTIAGFLNGFRTAAVALTDDPALAAETMYPQLGGIYLCALAAQERHAGAQAGPFLGIVQREVGNGFFDRLMESLDREPAYRDLTREQHRFARGVVRDAFAETPDVPINAASLAGFALGSLYARPFVSGGGVVAVLALMGATRSLLPRA